MDDLHRDLAAAGRQAQEHLPHAAFAEPPDQPVVTNPAWITGLELLHNPESHPTQSASTRTMDRTRREQLILEDNCQSRPGTMTTAPLSHTPYYPERTVVRASAPFTGTSGTPGGVNPMIWPYQDSSASRLATILSALRNPCDSPAKVKNAYGIPCAASSAAMVLD